MTSLPYAHPSFTLTWDLNYAPPVNGTPKTAGTFLNVSTLNAIGCSPT